MSQTHSLSRYLILTSVIFLTFFAATAAHADLVLARAGAEPLPIIVPADAPAANREAAHDLAHYIERIGGARPKVWDVLPDPPPERAIWVGAHSALPALWPDLDLAFAHPEEIRFVADDRHLVIAGRDRIRAADGRQIEFGTANAVYTFVERHLGVRWLWPGDLGTVVPETDTISLDPMAFRFHPPIRQRHFHYPRKMVQEENNRWFDVLQRGRGSLRVDIGHFFNTWWDRYHEEHPDIFAMQLDGSREPVGNPKNVKLCVSNPKTAELWLAEATRRFEADPDRLMVSAAPTDGGGWCLCSDCRAWDPAHAPPSTFSSAGRHLEHVMLTDRYVRFWNILARGLRERFPDREVYVGAMAYARYKTLPVEQVLEENVVIGYVGHFPITTEELAAREKAALATWGQMTSMLVYRPNLFWYSGGTWGLPNIALERTIDDMAFLARNNVVSLRVDSLFMNWANLGPQLYLLAQQAYDPLRDGRAVLRDYYAKGFGPAAEDIEAYFNVLAEGHARFIAWEDFRNSGSLRYRATDIYPTTYTPELLARAQAHLDAARDNVQAAPRAVAERVAFIQSGLDFTVLQLEVMQAMAPVRASKGSDIEAVQRAQERIAARDAFYETASPLAIDRRRVEYQTARRGMADYLGPIRDTFLQAAEDAAQRRTPGSESQPPSQLDPEWDPDLDG